MVTLVDTASQSGSCVVKCATWAATPRARGRAFCINRCGPGSDDRRVLAPAAAEAARYRSSCRHHDDLVACSDFAGSCCSKCSVVTTPVRPGSTRAVTACACRRDTGGEGEDDVVE